MTIAEKKPVLFQITVTREPKLDSGTTTYSLTDDSVVSFRMKERTNNDLFVEIRHIPPPLIIRPVLA